MRNNKGQFIKGHKVLEKWKKKWSQERKGIPNLKNAYPRTKKQLERLKQQGFQKGHIPYNKGVGNKKFNCIVCKKEIFDKPYRRKKFCSKECKNVYSHIMRGKNHWNYKGKNNQIQRCWSQYKEWHKKVLEKDNYTCQICKIKKGKLQVHHKKSFSKYPELRFVVSNGLTTHRKCHLEKIHKWKLKK